MSIFFPLFDFVQIHVKSRPKDLYLGRILYRVGLPVAKTFLVSEECQEDLCLPASLSSRTTVRKLEFTIFISWSKRILSKMPTTGKSLFTNVDLKTPPSTPFLERGPNSTGRKRKLKKSGKNGIPSTQGRDTFGRKSLLFLNVIIALSLYLGGVIRFPWQEVRALGKCQSTNHDLTDQLESCFTDIEETDKMSSGLLRDLMNTDNFREEFEQFRSSIGTSEETTGVARLQKTMDDISDLLHHEMEDGRAWKDMQGGLEGVWKAMIESECVCNNPEALDAQYVELRDRASSRANEG